MPRAPRAPLVAVLLLACAATSALAQRLSIRTFTGADGLGSSFVSDITQDASGYLWFATRDGLSRWNGYEFVTLGAADGFTSPAIERVRQVRSGQYFVVCNDGSLYSYQPSPADAHAIRTQTASGGPDRPGKVSFRRRTLQFDGRDIRFTRLYEDRSGVLWAGGHGVLVKGLGSTNTLISLARYRTPSGSVAIVHVIAEDGAGSMWVGTNVGLLRVSPDNAVTHYSLFFPGSEGVNGLALDADGRIWIGHRSRGVVVFKPGDVGDRRETRGVSPRPLRGERVLLPSRPGEAVLLTTANGLPDDRVTALLTTSEGRVWVGTANGLGRFDGEAFTRYSRENGLCDNLVHVLREDGDHHLWVATPTGAMRFVLEGFAGYSTREGLAADHIVSIAEGPEGTVYAIGIDWSVNAFDGHRFRASRLPLPPGASLMWASQAGLRDRNGRWWALTNEGLYRFEPPAANGAGPFRAASRVYGAADGLPSSHVFRLYQDRAGTFWVGTRSGDPAENGLANMDAALKRVGSFGPQHGLPPLVAPSAFVEDRDGTLWIGFYDGGLARYRDGRFHVFREQDGIPAGMVTSLVVDGSGRLWMATNSAGIGRVDDPAAERIAVRTYSTRDGLTSNNVRVLVDDRRGHIYAGTARGVDRLDPASGRVRQYGAEDGLLQDFVTTALCDSRGDLWFGTYGGVYRLQPGRERALEHPPIAVTALRVAGEPYPVQELGQASIEGLVLAPDQRDLAIDFVSVSRHRSHGISYQYSTGNGGDGWSAPTAVRTLNLARLAPGRYRISARAITADGLVSTVPAVVAFTVRPPVWQRWWMISLALIACGVVLLALYRYRVRRLLEIQRLRMAIASDLHDEVATNLSSIAMFSTLVRDQALGASPSHTPHSQTSDSRLSDSGLSDSRLPGARLPDSQTIAFLDRITVLATDSVDAIREIIWSIDPKPETMLGLLQRLRDAMVIPCRAHGIRLTVITAHDGMGGNLTPEQRKNIWLMLKEAVTNAVKHSGGTEVWVSATPAGSAVRIVVRDNGKGATAAAASSGLGLATMRARAESLGGTATLTSSPGGGTAVEFEVRLSG